MPSNNETPNIQEYIQIDTPGDDNTFKLNTSLCENNKTMSEDEKDIIEKGIKTANELVDQAYDVEEFTQFIGGINIEEGSELHRGLLVLAKENAENYNQRISNYLVKNNENHSELRMTINGLGFAKWTTSDTELISKLKDAAKRF